MNNYWDHTGESWRNTKSQRQEEQGLKYDNPFSVMVKG